MSHNSLATVRVFVPTYRRQLLLPRALDSLRAQCRRGQGSGMVPALLGFLIAHRLLLIGLPDIRPLPVEPRPDVALPPLLFAPPPREAGALPVPLPLFCARGEVTVTDGRGFASERFEEAARAGILAARAELFATAFLAAGMAFCTLDLPAALSFSR